MGSIATTSTMSVMKSTSVNSSKDIIKDMTDGANFITGCIKEPG